MKKLFLLISAIAIFTSCTKDPGEIRGVVTCLSNPKTQEYRSDVGALVYITKLDCDSLVLYYSATTLITFQTQGFTTTTDGPSNTEILKRKSDIIKAIEVDKNAKDNFFSKKQFNEYIKTQREYLENELKEVNALLSKFKNEKDYKRFILSQEQFIKDIKSSNNSLKAQVDASGNFTITQVEPGEYTAIIFSSASTPTSIPHIEKIHVDPKKTTTVNARFK